MYTVKMTFRGKMNRERPEGNLASTKMVAKSNIFPILSNGKSPLSFCNCLYTALNDNILPKLVRLSTERICSWKKREARIKTAELELR